MDYERSAEIVRKWQDGEIYAVGNLKFKILIVLDIRADIS